MNTSSDSTAQAADASFFASLKHEAHFYLVRHGKSEGNAQRLFQGRLDLPLADAGRQQARAVGTWLASKCVDHIVSSPLARAAETAHIIARACGRGEHPSFNAAFLEMDTGIFSGLGYDEAQGRHPEVFAAFRGHSWEAVPGAEKADALYDRAMAGWTLLRERATAGAKAQVCITHSGFMQWMLRATFGCRSWMPLFAVGNCGVFELVVTPTPSSLAYLQWRNLNFQAPVGRPTPRLAPFQQDNPFEMQK
jgi:broad specificity phosphatase PhoE